MPEASLGNLGEAKVLIRLDWGKLDSDLDETKNRIASSFETTGKKMRNIGLKMTAAISTPVIAGYKKAVDASSELEEATNAVNTVFEDGADIIEGYAERSAEAYGLSQSEFKQMAAVTGSFLQNLGYDAETAAEKSVELTSRASDMASVFNTDVDQALAAIQSGLKGEFNPLEQFGVKLNMAAINAKALEMGLGATNEELTDGAKAQAAMALVMEQTERISGDFKNTSDGLANSTRIFKAELADASAELGEVLIPVATEMVGIGRDLIGRFSELSPKTKENIVRFTGMAAAIGPVLMVGGQLLTMSGNLIGSLEKISSVLGITTKAFAGGVGQMGLYGAAIAGLLVAASHFAKKTKEIRDGMLEQRSGVIETTGSYDDYLASLDEYLTGTGLRIDRDGNLVNKMGAVVEANFRLSESQWEVNQSYQELKYPVEMATLDAGYYADQQARSGETSEEAAKAIEANRRAVELQAKAYQEAVNSAQSYTENFGSLISLAKSYDEVLGEIADKEARMQVLEDAIKQGGDALSALGLTSEEAKSELNNLSGEVDGLKAKMTEMANQVVLDMFYATLAIDGFTEDEVDAYFAMAEELGIISGEAADNAIAAWKRAQDYVNDNLLEPDVNQSALDSITTRITAAIDAANGRTIGVNVAFNSSSGLARLIGDVNIYPRAVGGPVSANTPYIVGEHGPELYVPDMHGSIISNDELVRAMGRITVDAEQAPRGDVIVHANVDSEIDIHRLARQIADEIRRGV